jgi:hypothetical protein
LGNDDALLRTQQHLRGKRFAIDKSTHHRRQAFRSAKQIDVLADEACIYGRVEALLYSVRGLHAGEIGDSPQRNAT